MIFALILGKFVFLKQSKEKKPIPYPSQNKLIMPNLIWYHIVSETYVQRYIFTQGRYRSNLDLIKKVGKEINWSHIVDVTIFIYSSLLFQPSLPPSWPFSHQDLRIEVDFCSNVCLCRLPWPRVPLPLHLHIFKKLAIIKVFLTVFQTYSLFNSIQTIWLSLRNLFWISFVILVSMAKATGIHTLYRGSSGKQSCNKGNGFSKINFRFTEF